MKGLSNDTPGSLLNPIEPSEHRASLPWVVSRQRKQSWALICGALLRLAVGLAFVPDCD